jgi:putative membrane protein
MVKDDSIFKAAFNPVVKTYIYLYVGCILLVSVIGIPLLIFWLLGVGQWYSKHYFEKLECEITERTLRFKKGILVQIEKTIPLENIQDITFIEGPLLRHFNLCMLKVETAGHSNPANGNEMSLIGIVDAPNFRKLVMDQRQRITEKVKSNDNVLVEIKDSLLRIEENLKRRG